MKILIYVLGFLLVMLIDLVFTTYILPLNIAYRVVGMFELFYLFLILITESKYKGERK